MNNIMKRTIAIVLTITLIIGLIPASTMPVLAAEPSNYTLSNGYINVTVSSENGGFQIETKDGDKVNKDDNNKNLLFPSSLFDTSYTSFRVTKGGKTNDYIFGRDYGFLGLSSSDVTITQDNTGINAVWSVDDLTFTQRISLANTGANEHGMAYISYSVKNNSKSDVDVKARIMLDTALGFQDFAYYELPGTNNVLTRVENERVIQNTNGAVAYEKAFFAYDDTDAPTITAYMVNASLNNVECKPYQIAFGHWNNLAASVFDFMPDKDLTFTNQYNKKYLTADSAYALYYNMGVVKPNTESSNVATYYGVFSNEKVVSKDRVSINMTAPSALEVNPSDTTKFKDNGNFTISTSIQNFVSTDAKKLDKIAIAVYTENGITPLDSVGGALSETPTYKNPYKIMYQNFDVGATQMTNWHFNAQIDSEAGYRKIEFKVFDMSNDPSNSGQLLLENLIGTAYCYILCPGGDGLLPKIQFTGSSPSVIYNEGTRHIYLTGKSFNMLENKSAYTLTAKRTDGVSNGGSFNIPSDNFVINSTENTADVIITDTMPVGSYELVFDWLEANKEDLTAPALKFTVSNDKKYKNDSYGVAAIIQPSSSQKKYTLKAFATEENYQLAKKSLGEVLIELRGEFSIKKDSLGNVVQVSGTSVDSSNANLKNLMTINNCLDFENGTLVVNVTNAGSDTSQKITVDFEGDLYTSGARTPVWTGIAGLTSIDNGTDYELISYNEQGTRKSGAMANKQPITLIWPSAASMAQTLAGMVMNFRYGELGVIKNSSGAELQRVLSFGAAMDLSFLIPSNSKTKPNLSTWETVSLLLVGNRKFTQDGLRQQYALYEADVKAKGQAEKGAASVNVEDILFGGQFIGFNTTVELSLPPYTPAMPNIEGVLTINTIGDWKVGVYGKCKFIKMELEVAVNLRGKNGYPVPDKLFFYMGGFTPGVNIDGFGVVWVQGVGGGIDNLYETIFPSDSIPPFKLLLSAQLALMSIVEARADLALSLRGIGVKLSDGKIVATDIKVLNSAKVQFDWYPDFYFLASVNLTIYEIINGAGYIVVEDDGFFEFFVRAALSIPEKYPIIGGMTLAQAELGANAQKLWGVIELLKIRAGVTYYWGGDVEFGVGDKATQPTYPELLGFEDIPVYYDEETNRTLYMHVGSNFSLSANTEIVEDINAPTVKLMGASSYVKSNAAKLNHIVNLGSRGLNDAALELKFKVDSLEAAKNITIKDGSNDYGLVWYNSAKNADDPENANANAYVNYNTETKIASVSVTFTDASAYNKDWNITTPSSADLILYNVLVMPQFDSVSCTYNNGTVLANWDGTLLEQLDSISFFAVENPSDTGVLVYKTNDKNIINSKQTSFTLPETLPSGNYYIKAVASKEGVLSETQTTSIAFAHTNSAQPNCPSSVSIVNGGDYTFDVNTLGVTGDFDGYIVNIYEKQADGSFILNDASGLLHDKNEAKISVGGRYSYTDPSIGQTLIRGLTSGKSYKVGVCAYNIFANDIIITSEETLSQELVLNAPIVTNIACVADKTVTPIRRIEGKVNGSDNIVLVDTYKDKNIDFTLSASEKVTGKWTIDNLDNVNGRFGTVVDKKSFDIQLDDLSDGDHTLTFLGTNNQGDGVLYQKRFSIDTLAPKLLLTAPVNGGLFEKNGDLSIKGVTDKDAIVKVIVNKQTVYNAKPTIDIDGLFSITVKLDSSKASHNVEIYAVDEISNSTNETLTVTNKALGDITRLELYSENQIVTNKSLKLNETGDTVKQLSIKAVCSNGQSFVIDDSRLIEWKTSAFGGNATISQNGTITIGKDSQGFVIGRLVIASNKALSAAASFGSQYSSAVTDKPDPVVPPTAGGGESQQPSVSIGIVSAKAGEMVTYPVPKGVDQNIIVPTYIVNGKTLIVPLCEVVDDMLRFIAPIETKYTIVLNDVCFDDIANHWGRGAIKFMASRGIVNGVGKNKFSPNGTLSRAMFVTMLGRLHGVDNYISKTNPFKDVKDGDWYTKYTLWAYENGIITGDGNGNFKPDQPATREEICVMLMRYIKWSKINIDATSQQNAFVDEKEISTWALEAVEYCRSIGLVKGNDKQEFLPGNSINRAEDCTMLMRLIMMLVK